MNRMSKQWLAAILSVMMVLSSLSPVFALTDNVEAPSEQPEVVQETDTTDESTVSGEPAEGNSEEEFATMVVKPKDAEVYPVLIGEGYEDDRFTSVEWADYIEAKEAKSLEFYEEYLKLYDKKVSDKEKAEVLDELVSLVDAEIEKAKVMPLDSLEGLPFGVYYITKKGYEPTLVTLVSSDPFEVELQKAEVREAPKDAKETQKKSTKKSEASKAPALRAGSSLEFNEEDIEKFTAEFVRGADIQRDGSVIWTPDTSNADHRFVYKVTYAFSGVGEIAAGDVEIRVPKRVIKDRDGNYADYYDIAIPSEEEYAKEPDPEVKWIFKEAPDDANELIIYNRGEISAAEAGTIEVSYLTEKQTTFYTDMSSTDDFHATLVVKNEDAELTAEASASPIIFDTHANIVSVTKENPRLFREWDSSFGTKPEDADDYYYLVWTIRTQFDHYATQPYDLTYVDTFDDGEVVGFRFKGESEYTTENVRRNIYQRSNERYDYVLTRHPKSEFAGRDYTVWNRITATVHPIDNIDEDTSANDRAPFQYKLPEYKRPPGRFYAEKFGQYLNDYSTSETQYGAGSEGIVQDSEDISDFSLTEFKEGTNSVIDNPKVKYYAFLRGYPYPWTLEDGADPDEPSNYGKMPVRYEFTDEDLCIEEKENLGPGDYEITKLRITSEFLDAVFDEEDLEFKSCAAKKSVFTENNDLILYAKKANDTDWVYIGKWSFVEDKYYDMNSEYVASTEDTDIFFKPGVLGYKWTTSNALYYTRVNSYPTIKLFRTDKVLSDIGDKRKIALKNTAHIKVYDYQNRELFPKGALNAHKKPFASDGIHNVDYIAGVIRESHIEKNVTGAIPNKSKRFYTVSWRIRMNESYQDNEGRHYKTQESGRFYDLCPAGSHPDVDSIEVFKNGYTRLSKNDYTVRVVPNWKKSGRYMVIIDINTPGERYTFNIDTIHEWEDLKDTTFDVLNPVAYETGNENIAEGYPDSGGDSKDKALMTDLDPDTDAVKFIYSENKHEIDLITATSTGLNKKVRAQNDQRYSYSTFTTVNGEYYYRIRLQNDTATKTKGIIFYDSLENYANTEVSSDWHGTLQDVDVANLKSVGIAPVVYYSSIENLDIYAHNDLNEEIDGEKVWKTEEEFGDITNAKAVAIDCRKTADGEDYYLHHGDSLQARLIMKAPSEDTDVGRIRYAYNNVFMHAIEINEHDEEHEDLIRHDYTKIGYKVSGSAEFLKVDSANHNNTISGINFRVTGTSAYGTSVDETYTSGNDGLVAIKNLEMGTYEICELESSDDWLVDRDVHHITIDGTGRAECDLPFENGQYIWENEARVHGDISFVKKAIENDDGYDLIPNTTFTLSGTSDYGTTMFLEGTTDEEGVLSFTNLEKGSYSLVESKANPDFVPDDTVRTVIIDSSGNGSIKNGKLDADGYIIENTPRYHDFDIRKVDADDNSIRLEGAEFTLTGKSNLGTEYVDVKAVTNARGIATFERIEAGTYVIQETKAPARHMLDPIKRKLVLDDNGNVTIEGLEKENGICVWPNEKSLDGRITITKKWVDGKTNAERPTPKIHLYNDSKYYNNTEMFVELDLATGVLRFFRDTKNKYYERQTIGNKIYYTNVERRSIAPWESPWSSDPRYGNKIRKVVFEDVVKPIGMQYWFANSKITSIDLSMIDTSNLTSIQYMFSGSSVRSINFGDHFATDKVENMQYMFSKCANLRTLDLSGFDTSSVTTSNGLFSGCKSLVSVNMHGWDLSKSSTLQDAFSDCDSIQYVDLSDVIMPSSVHYVFDKITNTPETAIHINTDGTNWRNVNSLMEFIHSDGATYIDSLYIKDLGADIPSGGFSSYFQVFDGGRVHAINGPVVFDNPNLNGFSSTLEAYYPGDVIIANAKLPRTVGAGFLISTGAANYGSYENLLRYYNYSDEEKEILKNLDCNIYFHNIDASDCVSMEDFLNNPPVASKVIDFRGIHNTQNLRSMKWFGGNLSGDNQLIIMGDGFDTSSVTDMQNAFSNGSGTGRRIYFGSNNFKLDNADANYSNMFDKFTGTTVYSDISEVSTLVPENVFLNATNLRGGKGSEISSDTDSPLYNRNTDLYKYYKVDGGVSNPGLFTPTSEANLPPGPDVKYAEALEYVEAERDEYFSDFNHGPKATPLNIDTSGGSSDPVFTEVALHTEDLAGAAYFWYEYDGKCYYVPLSGDYNNTDVTFVIPSGNFGVGYNHSAPAESGLHAIIQATDIHRTDEDPGVGIIRHNGTDTSVTSYIPTASYGGSADATARRTICSFVNNSATHMVADEVVYSAEDVAISTVDRNDGFFLQYHDPSDQSELVTVDDQWVKNGNVWTYTFHVNDDEMAYHMVEEALAGYQAKYVGGINTEAITKSGSVINSSTDTGHIHLQKLVENGTIADANRQFEFKITLHADNPSLLDGAMQCGDTVFVNGEATVKLSAAEADGYLIYDVPTWCTFTVEETSHPSFSVSSRVSGVGDTATGDNVISGSIVKDRTANVEFTNTRTNPSSSSFSVRKEVTGTEDSNTAFDFTAVISGLEPNDVYKYTIAGTEHKYHANAVGTASVSFSLKHNQVCLFNGLPTEATYRVTEAANKYRASYEVESATGADIRRPFGTNNAEMTDLTTETECTGTTVTFTNHYEEKESDTAELKFVKKANDNGEVLEGAVYKLVGTTADGEELSVMKTSDSNGEFVFRNIPDGHYTFSEEKAPAGFSLDPAVRDVTIVNGHPMHYSIGEVGTAVSHSPNVSDEGAQLSNYDANLSTNDVVTIPGAGKLKVDLYYNGENVTYDWLSVWKGSYPNYTASWNRLASGYVTTDDGAPNNSNKFGGSQSGIYTVNGNTLTNMGHRTLEFEGDTVTFGFKSDGGGYGKGYGYYAIVTGLDVDRDLHEISVEGLSMDNKGVYNVTDARANHGKFNLEKISSINHDMKLRGAEFTLYNSENVVVTRETSNKKGIVKFVNILPGTYTLKETDAPTGYVRSDTVYTVTVDADSNVTISDATGSMIESVEGNYQIENTPIPVDFNLTKRVTGPMGDPTKVFAFNVAVENAKPNAEYSVTMPDSEDITFTTDAEGKANVAVGVKHGQTAVINDLPYNSKVTVTEPASEYTSQYTVMNGDRVVDRKINLQPNTELSTNQILLDGECSAEFVNYLDRVVPTGVQHTTNVLLLICIGLTFALGIILNKRKRILERK